MVNKIFSLSQNEKAVLDILEIVLNKFDVKKYYYNLYSPMDDAYCLKKSNDSWAVYYFERGNKHNLKTFNNIKECGNELIKKLVQKEDLENASALYERMLSKMCVAF